MTYHIEFRNTEHGMPGVYCGFPRPYTRSTWDNVLAFNTYMYHVQNPEESALWARGYARICDKCKAADKLVTDMMVYKLLGRG